MAAGSTTGKITVVANTPVQIAGSGLGASGKIETHARTSGVKLVFVPASTPAVSQIGTQAALVGNTGFLVFVPDNTVGEDDLQLVADEALWFVSDKNGELRFRRD